MYFKQFLDERCGCASYLIASRKTRDAAVIDPGTNIEQYLDIINQRDMTLRYVIDTHVHADHISGARRMAEATGAEVCLFAAAQVAYPFRPVNDGEELLLGPLKLRALHTPGHRPELMSLLITNPLRSPEPSMVLTGDSLLVGDVGRPDFGGGDASAQFESLNRLLRLPDWVAVFPGHFEGPCGAGMCGRPNTTIGFERLFNPLARLEREPFVAQLAGTVPPRPLNITAIESTNRGTADIPWAMLTTSPQIDELDVLDAGRLAPETLVLDVREPHEYASGHLPGAVNLPQADLAIRLDEVPRGRPIAVVCQSGFRSLRSAQFLVQSGIPRVVSLAGGTAAWREAGRLVEQDAAEVTGPRIIDTEWAHGGGLQPRYA